MFQIYVNKMISNIKKDKPSIHISILLYVMKIYFLKYEFQLSYKVKIIEFLIAITLNVVHACVFSCSVVCDALWLHGL